MGLFAGLSGVAAITTALALVERHIVEIPGPTLAYTLLVLGVAYAWGWWVGGSVAAATFVCIWYFFVPP